MQPNTPDLHPHFGGEKGKVLADTPRDGMAASASPTNRPMRWREEADYVLKTSRPGFWLTQIWFFLLPLAQVPLLDSPRFWLGIVYISFGLGFVLYGWNDLVDAETDRLNPRKDSFGRPPR